MKLLNKVAIVTGASSGIGKAIAEKFVAEGAKVMFSDIHTNSDVAERFPNQAMFQQCNVSISTEVDQLVAKTVEVFGGLDIMVNNAGISLVGSVVDTTDEVWNKTMAVNLSGMFFGTRAAARYMQEKQVAGSIINMSSVMGDIASGGSVAYCASKGGVIQMTKASAVDLAKNSIRVNAIAPGAIETKMTEGLLQDDKMRGFLEQANPMGRVGSPEDIAEAALYLAANDSSKYVTGTVLFVDGGWRVW